MKSVAIKNWTVIDCRNLIFQGRFYKFSPENRDNLLQDLYRFFNSLLGDDCVISWEVNNKSGGKDKTKIKLNIDKDGWCAIDVEACYKNSGMKYKKDLKNYTHYLSYPPFGHNTRNNYDEYYEKMVLPNIHDDELIKRAILKIYNDNGKYLEAQYRGYDFDGLVISRPSRDNCETNRLFGEFWFTFSIYSLDERISDFSSKMMEFGQELLLKYERINISVGIDSMPNSYIHVFGWQSDQKIPFENPSIKEFADYMCLRNISWGNLISKYTLKLPDYKIESNSENVDVTYLDEGGCIVQCNKSIEDTDLAELRQIKSLLYPYILPGESVVPKNWEFRRKYELVPVFEDEISIDEEGQIHLSHNSTLNMKVMKQLYLALNEDISSFC